MTDACYCDFDFDGYPDVYDAQKLKARVKHKCYECFGSILPGEIYERVASLYDGSWTTSKTCVRCLSVREYVLAHAPCFCWQHGSMLDDARQVIDEHGHVSAGFYIGAMKRVLRAERYRKASLA